MVDLQRWRPSSHVLTVVGYAAIGAIAIGFQVPTATAQLAKALPESPTVEATSLADDTGFANTSRPLGASPLGATECGHCHDTNPGLHWAHGLWTPMSGAGMGHGWHFWSASGWCLSTHGICIVAVAPGEYETVDTRELVELLAAAVAAQDAEALARLVDSPSVRWMSARAALQVLGCDGETIVGHVPLERSLWSEVVATSTSLDR